MTLRAFLTIHSIVAGVYGVLFVAMPAALLPLYGGDPSETAVLMGRYFGSALLTFAAVLWLARASGDSPARRAVVLGFFVGLVAGFLVALHAQLSGVVNALGWTTVAVYAVFAAGYGYFHFSSRQGAGIGGAIRGT